MGDPKFKLRPDLHLIEDMLRTHPKWYEFLRNVNLGVFSKGAIKAEQIDPVALSEAGDDVFVNAVDVGPPVNFNDTTPAAPTGFANVKWQRSFDGVRDNISAYASFPPGLPVKTQCAIIGGMRVRADSISDGTVVPFLVDGSSAVGESNNVFLAPYGGYAFNPKVVKRATETAQSLDWFGFETYADITGLGGEDQFYFAVPPLAAGIANYGASDGGPVLRVNELAGLKFLTERAGVASAIGAPGWSALWFGDSGRYPFASETTAAAFGTTRYMIFAGGGQGFTAGPDQEKQARIVLPAGKLKRMVMLVSAASTGTAASTLTILKNGVATGLTQVFPVPAVINSVFIKDSDVSFNGTTDTASIEWVTAGASGVAAVVFIFFGFEPTTIGHAPILCGPNRTPGTLVYSMPYAALWRSATESEQAFPLSRPGTMKAADQILYLASELYGGRVIDVAIRKTGAASGLAWNLTEANVKGAVAATGPDVAWTETDYVTLQDVLTTAGATASGRVETNGTAVTWKQGDLFSLKWEPGDTIVITGVGYTIASVNSTTSLTLTTSAGVQNCGDPQDPNTCTPYTKSNVGGNIGGIRLLLT